MVSAMDISAATVELSEIVELPSLGASCDELGGEFAFVDSVGAEWGYGYYDDYQSTWLERLEDCGPFDYGHQTVAVPSGSGGSLRWDCY